MFCYTVARKIPIFKLNFLIFAIFSLTLYVIISYLLINVWHIRLSKSQIDVAPTSAPLSLPYVVVHIDLKGSPPKLGYLESVLPILKRNGANALLIEYEDMFPYDGKLINLSSTRCYQKAELLNFLKKAFKFGFEVIPLIQTFGHMEHVLKLKDYSHLRETYLFPDCICPSNAEGKLLIQQMLDQVIKLHERVTPLKHIHIGADEVFHIAQCDACKQRRQQESVLEMFLNHIIGIIEFIRSKNPDLKILMWDDMLRTRKPNESFNQYGEVDIEPVVWDYKTHITVQHTKLYNYHKNFDNIWIASAFKGADGRMATFPLLNERYLNNLSWMKYIYKYKFGGDTGNSGFKGIILTGWSRYSHFEPLCELLPVSLPSLILNLILIKNFKGGVIYTDKFKNALSTTDTFVFNIEEEWKVELKCNNSAKLEDFTGHCAFDGSSLYTSLKKYVTLIRYIIRSLTDINSEFSSLAYYAKSDYIDLNLISRRITQCKEYEKVLFDSEMEVVELMTRYFSKEVYQEFIAFKSDYIKELLKKLGKIMKDAKKARIWGRRGAKVHIQHDDDYYKK